MRYFQEYEDMWECGRDLVGFVSTEDTVPQHQDYEYEEITKQEFGDLIQNEEDKVWKLYQLLAEPGHS